MRLIRTLACAAAGALMSAPGFAAINASALVAVYNAGHTAITFNVYSSRATRIELWLYAAGSGQTEKLKVVMTKGTGNVWTSRVTTSALTSAGISSAVYYGYRAWGPNWTYNSSWTKGSSLGFVADVDARGNRFNPNKLLMDPYAHELSQDPTNPSNPDGTVYGSGATYRLIDSGTAAPKGIVFVPDTQSIGTKPTRAFKDDVIYEVNVRGLTMSDTSVTAAWRGTYKGAGQKAAWLASLGVTAVEFLPVQETQNDTNDVVANTDTGDNYWGYSTLNWFAPDRRYSSDKTAGGPTKEFKTMVKALHAAGIKVMLDVVYNHSGEGGAWSPTDTTTYNVMS
jgi:isoamylase